MAAGMFDFVDKLQQLRGQAQQGSSLGSYSPTPKPMLSPAAGGGLSNLSFYRDVLNTRKGVSAGLGAAARAASNPIAAGSAGAASTLGRSGSTQYSGNDLVERIAAAIRRHESGGNYNIRNQSEPANVAARGAYQFIPSTYSSLAGKYGRNANDWSPATQDYIAKRYISEILAANANDPRQVAANWYVGHSVHNPQEWASVPYPSAGNTMTIQSYADWLMRNL